MSDSNRDSSTIVKCPQCKAVLIVRVDQFGRRLRCSKCNHSFVSKRPDQPTIVQNPREDAQDAREANEPAPVYAKRAKMATRFDFSASLVFKATVQAIRGFNCTLVKIDQASHNVCFSLSVQGIEMDHEAYVFELSRSRSEIELTSRLPAPEKAFDRFYEAIVKEIDKYLMFAHEPGEARESEDHEKRRDLLALKYDQDDSEDNDYDDHRSKQQSNQPMAVAGLVCGIVGLATSCIPIMGIILGILGIIFGSLGKGGRSDGMATAGIVCGIVAVAFALILFLLYLFNPHLLR